MPKDKRQIQRGYHASRKLYKTKKRIKKKIVEFKKDRRVPLGPYTTFYFEVTKQC